MRCSGLILLLILACLPIVGRSEWIVDGDRFPAAVTPVVEEKTYPVLVLQLGGQWTDFELKASTNNFESMVYYTMSSATNQYMDDTNVWVYYTDDYSPDVRQWLKSETATSIGSQLTDPVNAEVEYVVVCPSHECSVDWSTWMTETNSNLIWSYVRYDGINLEYNATGTKTHWNPVVPVEWRKTRVAP